MEKGNKRLGLERKGQKHGFHWIEVFTLEGIFEETSGENPLENKKEGRKRGRPKPRKDYGSRRVEKGKRGDSDKISPAGRSP